MTTATETSARTPQRGSPPIAARLALKALGALSHGQLEVECPDGITRSFGAAQSPHSQATSSAPMARIHVTQWSVFGDIMREGDIGFAQAYIDGRWSSPDLVALLRVLAANRAALEGLVYGSRLGAWFNRLRHGLRRNTRSGSRRNIHAHYDLGNAFYGLWLDPTFNYSSAWFDGQPGLPLDHAQRLKMRRALAECHVKPGARLLEIGCGWGALAELATTECGSLVTGITLSEAQLGYARERLRRQSLQADLRLQDYRDLPDAPFDAVVSIEMFEAVGRAYWPSYFQTLRRMLKPGGRACVQSIVIRDELFERYASSSDFIQQYIFPGGMLPSPQVFAQSAQAAGLKIVNQFAFGPDYAHTLRHWRKAFHAQEPAVRALGFDTAFIRTWDFYLAYCEAAFDEGDTDVMQFTLAHA